MIVFDEGGGEFGWGCNGGGGGGGGGVKREREIERGREGGRHQEIWRDLIFCPLRCVRAASGQCTRQTTLDPIVHLKFALSHWARSHTYSHESSDIASSTRTSYSEERVTAKLESDRLTTQKPPSTSGVTLVAECYLSRHRVNGAYHPCHSHTVTLQWPCCTHQVNE